MTERIPAEVFPPGEFLADELEARGWTQSEFAEIIRRPIKLVNEIIAGKKLITPETARALAAALGTSPQYWLNLESAYQLSKAAQAPVNEVITRDAKLREFFPIREMVKRNWIQASSNFDVLERRVYKFFEIDSLNEAPELAHAARRNYSEDLSPNQLAWLFRVRSLASAIATPKYSEGKLKTAISKLETLMMEPEEVRHVPSILSESGVRLVIVEPIPNSKIDGVCLWLNNGQSPVVGLTLKGDYIDRFWFNLRHELEHVLRRDGVNAAIIDDFDEAEDSTNEAEVAANMAAAEFCVPQAKLKDFIVRHDPIFSTESFVGFSRLMKRHPGIVAGQLQKHTGNHRLFKKNFQVRIRDLVTETVVTDGYGKSVEI